MITNKNRERQKHKESLLTQDIVRELLDYNPETGALTWKWRDRRWFTSDRIWKRWNKCHADKPALTSKTRNGYLNGHIFNKTHKAHSVIWLWMTGVWPNPEVDHENHIRDDNRWSNLQETSNNVRNQSLRSTNTSGQVGAYKIRNGWGMEIGSKYRGTFKTFEEAVAARKAAEKKYGYHKNHGASKDKPGVYTRSGPENSRNLLEKLNRP